jgi:hypothetical protein
MNIAVKDDDPLSQTFSLHASTGHSNVIEHTIPFPSVRKSMVGPPGQIHGCTVPEGFPAGLKSGTARAPAPLHKWRRPGKPDSADFFGRQVPPDDPINIIPSMDSKEIVIGCRLGDTHGFRLDDLGFGDTPSENGIFLNGKRMSGRELNTKLIGVK